MWVIVHPRRVIYSFPDLVIRRSCLYIVALSIFDAIGRPGSDCE